MFDNLNNYRVFYTVANTGSISRAADTLFISQPAISKSIAKLEEGLGIKLFSRSAKGVLLTEEGKILYQHITKAFDSINQGEEEIKRINDLGIGQLRIGVSSSLCKHILLPYLQDFITENPHINVIIDCHSTINTVHLLTEGKIDIGLICETEIPKGYKYKKLTDIHDIFVATDSYIDNLMLREQEDTTPVTDNPWLFAGNLTSLLNSDTVSDKGTSKTKNNTSNTNQNTDKNKLSIKDILEKSNLMLLEKNNITRTHIDNYLTDEHIHPNQILEVNNMDLLIDFASIGMGVASVVREFAKEQLASGQIIELELEKDIEKRTVGFIYSNTKNKSTVLEKFLGFF